MILDPWTFLRCQSVDLVTNRGIQCGIDIQGKGLSYSKGQKTLLVSTTTSQNMSKWAWMNGITSIIKKKTLWDMSMKNWEILGYIELVVCFKVNIVCNWRLNNLFHDAWHMIEFLYHLMHPLQTTWPSNNSCKLFMQLFQMILLNFSNVL